MYIVISKPKRMSLAAGFSHFMQLLLCVYPARRGQKYPQHTCWYWKQYALIGRFATSEKYGLGAHDFHESGARNGAGGRQAAKSRPE
jgi:hypothetical protein